MRAKNKVRIVSDDPAVWNGTSTSGRESDAEMANKTTDISEYKL